jgi:hypothetical protein
MLIYRCRVCNRIFGFPSPPALARCSSCKGGLVYLGQDQPPNEIQVNKEKEKKGGLNWDVLLNLLKGLGAFWGTGGAINIVGKSVNKEKIGKGDLSHTLLPLAGAGLIHGFQHPQRVKNFFLPAQSRIETDEKVRKVIQIIRGQGLNKGSQNPPSVVPQDKVNYRFEGREDPTNQRGKGVSKNTETVRVPRGFQWLRILSTRPRILILGGQGTAKSCLAFWLLEILHPRCPCFVYRLPAEGASFIPPWLGIVNELNRAPPGSIVLVDEAYLSFFSRESQTRQNREITRIVNLARQKNLGLIFVAHEARHIDKNILSCIRYPGNKKTGTATGGAGSILPQTLPSQS